jgi:hypothetical protein
MSCWHVKGLEPNTASSLTDKPLLSPTPPTPSMLFFMHLSLSPLSLRCWGWNPGPQIRKVCSEHLFYARHRTQEWTKQSQTLPHGAFPLASAWAAMTVHMRMPLYLTWEVSQVFWYDLIQSTSSIFFVKNLESGMAIVHNSLLHILLRTRT